MLSLDNSTEVLKNTTAAFTKKIALVGKLWTKFYFNYIKLSLIILLIKLLMLMHVESTECDIKDRIIDSSRNNEFKSQEVYFCTFHALIIFTMISDSSRVHTRIIYLITIIAYKDIDAVH